MKKRNKEQNAAEMALPGMNMGQKMAYALQDSGCTAMTTLINSFGMLYWGNVVGMNLGILGSLMLASKIFDGISDVIAGTIIDRTESRHGKARAWMIRTLLLMLIFGVLLFTVPSGISASVQYVYFFIVYTIFNDVLYTMNNIAFSTLAVRATRRQNDQIQLGTLRFIFSTVAGVVISAATMGLVSAFGGSRAGWRMVAVIYAVFFGICQTICIVFVKELPDDDSIAVIRQDNPLKQLVDNVKFLIRNKYFLFHLTSMVLFTLSQQIMSASGIYYMKYILGNEEMFGVFSMTTIALVAGLAFVPMLTKRIGTRTAVLAGLILSCAMGIVFWFACSAVNLPLMLITNSFRWFGCATFIGSATVVLPGKIGQYSLLRDHVNIEATVFSCVSMGTKVGAGLSSAILGWLLSLGGFISSDDVVQPQSALNMIIIIFAVVPLLCQAITLVCNYFQKVEAAVKALEQ